MAIDNEVYEREAGSWRDPNHFLSLLVPLTPPRIAYLQETLRKVGIDPQGKSALDVGCGGGLVAEEVARLGCRVTGVDPSAASIERARRHAEAAGLEIDYRQAPGEALPFPDASFDIVYCLDVLEHVDNLDRVIAESARVLKPGGVYIYDTVNRTRLSKLIAITLMQDWAFTSIMPRNFHVWSKFITPQEMEAVTARHGLEHGEITGLRLTPNPLTLLRLIRKVKRGEATYWELGEYMVAHLSLGSNVQTSYLGYATRPG